MYFLCMKIKFEIVIRVLMSSFQNDQFLKESSLMTFFDTETKINLMTIYMVDVGYKGKLSFW